MNILRLYKRARKKIRLLLKGELEADVILSAGDACRAAFYLQKHGLRAFSSPLDWMMCYSLKDMSALIASHFKDFFKDSEELYINGDTRVVKDRQNGMVAMHAFPAKLSIEAFYPEFEQVMQRRAGRLIEGIKSSKQVIFICTRGEDISEFKDFLRFLYAFHPANYTLINIRHDANLKDIRKKRLKFAPYLELEPPRERERERERDEATLKNSLILFKRLQIYFKFIFLKLKNFLKPPLQIIEYSFNDIHEKGADKSTNPDFWIGNAKIWDEILSKIKLKKLNKNQKIEYFN